MYKECPLSKIRERCFFSNIKFELEGEERIVKSDRLFSKPKVIIAVVIVIVVKQEREAELLLESRRKELVGEKVID